MIFSKNQNGRRKSPHTVCGNEKGNPFRRNTSIKEVKHKFNLIFIEQVRLLRTF